MAMVSSMPHTEPCVLASNGGWSNMTFTLFETRDLGKIARIDLSDSSLCKAGLGPANNISQAVSRQYPEISQVACFEMTFHHDLPRVVRNIPVGGYIKENTIITTFNMTVLNDLDHIHFVMDLIDRLLHIGKKRGNPQ